MATPKVTQVQAPDLLSLHEKVFENLVYDLLALRGVINLVWRTPGADGGRDLEGLVPLTDFSGGIARQRWYIECKRYTASISWPTVFEKAAYALNANADYLLFVTTSGFSPKCLDEVARWNAANSIPQIRQWPGHELKSILSSFPKLLLKYGLVDAETALPISVFRLSLEIAKSVQAAEAASVFDQDPSAFVVVASALSDLLTGRVDDFERAGKIVVQAFRCSEDGYEWLDTGEAQTLPIDRLGGRSLLAAIYLATSARLVVARTTGLQIGVQCEGLEELHLRDAQPLLSEICLWSDMEVQYIGNRLLITQRRADG